MTDKPSIYACLAAVMGDVQAIGKDGRNERDGYAFRGIDSTMNAVGPALRAHGVIVVPTVLDARYEAIEIGRNRTVMRECTVRVKFTFYGPAGDSIECVTAGEAMDVADKSASKAQSVAMRVALLQALCVPTGDEEPDAKTHRRAPRQDRQQANATHASLPEYDPMNPAGIKRAARQATSGSQQEREVDDAPLLLTDRQSKRLHTLLTGAGWTDRDEKLAYLAEVVGRDISSSKELSRFEAAQCIRSLEVALADRRDEPVPS